jgi:hypothetical protein
MKSSKCKILKSNVKKKKTASTTSRIKWIKEVQQKLDGGTITSFDMKIGQYTMHIWQMYGPGNKWNWHISDTSREDRKYSGGRKLMQSPYQGEETAIKAKQRMMKAFIWYFAMRLARNTDEPSKVLKGFEDE